MNMRTPRYLRDSDPALSNVPIQPEPVVEIADVEYEWMAEELENVERQVEHELWEEAFIEACFEEMLAEEDAQWHHFTYLNTNTYAPLTVPLTGPTFITPLVSPAPSVWAPCYYAPVSQTMITPESINTVFRHSQPISCSRLNPEAPEFVPRGPIS